MFSSFLKYFWLMEYKKDGAGMQRWLACRFQLSPVYQVKLRCRERTTTSCTNKLHLIYIPEEPKAYGGNSWFRFLLVDGLFELQVRFSVVSGLSARLCCLSFLLCSASCFLSSPWVSLSLYLSSCSPTPCTFCFFSSHASRIPVGELLKTWGGQVALVFDCSYFAPAAHCSYAFRQNHRRNPHYCSDFISKRKGLFKDVWLDGHVWLCLILDVTECVKDWNSHICMVNLEKKAKFKHSSVKLL